MSFDKKYPKSKDARKRGKRYRDSRDFDRSCRHGGNCAWCRSNRTHNTEKRALEAQGRAD